MRVRIRDFRLVEGEWVKDIRVVARFTAQLDHFRLFDLKLMHCPDRGFLVWATRNVRLSMEGREVILRGVLRKVERAERFGVEGSAPPGGLTVSMFSGNVSAGVTTLTAIAATPD